jgi:hypothetical protein
MTVSTGLKIMWEEVVEVEFKVLSQNSAGGRKKNHEKSRQIFEADIVTENFSNTSQKR